MKRFSFWHVVVFLAPAFLIYTVFSAYPLLDTLRQGFYTTSDTGHQSWIGIANYTKLLTDPQWSDGFWNAMKNNVKFFLIHMCIQNPIGLLLAALLSLKGVKGAKAYQTVLFLPTLLSVVIIGFIWQLILSPLWGVSESLMTHVGLGEHFAPWLGQEETALITLALISVWQFVGIPMMLIYASLIAIPEEIIEAAVVEGASPWRIFWTIRLPLILPTLGLVTILTFVGNFNAFDLIYSVKGAIAGPNFSTDILGTYFYRTFFGYQSQVGSPTMGAAVATTMFLIILAGVGVYTFLIQRKLQRHSF
ncbi:raffinose/stachyose/melibiose transport system permease protein [Andreprevotia lacus DSM 23236]|jgi:raffinose/stachyose/melibiose transport system permease protein|uniref:Raffinose/stachyose/melibiose transport system permease protein n=1 Tax=Andreprevotia lacus DSM 23236 TaxID=1121001 RepID=A0A1W1X2G7_9NEIS|nr:sugar ABC transporter permease [Andreprevotia lacus]SMC18104.1 raffinose/stachyose/melibiose transport system permease protein [Andreprevotia lacus DSM 23236]